MDSCQSTPIPSQSSFRLIGSVHLPISLIGLGGAPLANFFRQIPDEDIELLICYCIEKGISLFDTAPQYGAGLSERRLGAALCTVPRDRFTLSTKVGRLVQPDGKMKIDYTRDGILRSLEESLERLGIGHVDIVHIHDPDHHYQEALDVVFPTLAELRAQGVIGAIGAGMNQWQMPLEFARNADFDCFMVAGRYTLLEQASLPLLNYCQEKGIALLLGGVYNTGILATGAVPEARYNYRPATPAILKRVEQLEAICQKYAVPLRAVALQFPAAHPAVASLVLGMESDDEVDDALLALRHPVPPEVWREFQAAGLIDESAPLPATKP